jgi:choline dehydrogenase
MAMGNDAWDFDSMYHVYQSLENDPARGLRGPHPIIRASEQNWQDSKSLFNGAHQCGFTLILDLNAPSADGAGPSPVCRQGDGRVSAADTFIEPIRHLPNLSILSELPVAE